MSETESLEVASVRSVCGHPFEPGRWSQRPFRAPHHSASAVALVGGGSRPRPGEISLAHRGVLFLDELPEFERRALEALREPLESGTIVVSRAALRARFPARFQLVATMNPCPCGHLGDGTGRCGCTPEEVRRYRSRISGPLLDRIDLHVEVPRVRIPASLAAPPAGPTSASARGDATRVHELQRSRYGLPAAGLDGPALAHHCALGDAGTSLLEAAVERLGLSPRARHRVQRVARTIADLAGRERIVTEDLAEALAYRCMDRPVAGFR